MNTGLLIAISISVFISMFIYGKKFQAQNQLPEAEKQPSSAESGKDKSMPLSPSRQFPPLKALSTINVASYLENAEDFCRALNSINARLAKAKKRGDYEFFYTALTLLDLNRRSDLVLDDIELGHLNESDLYWIDTPLPLSQPDYAEALAFVEQLEAILNLTVDGPAELRQASAQSPEAEAAFERITAQMMDLPLPACKEFRDIELEGEARVLTHILSAFERYILPFRSQTTIHGYLQAPRIAVRLLYPLDEALSIFTSEDVSRKALVYGLRLAVLYAKTIYAVSDTKASIEVCGTQNANFILNFSLKLTRDNIAEVEAQLASPDFWYSADPSQLSAYTDISAVDNYFRNLIKSEELYPRPYSDYPRDDERSFSAELAEIMYTSRAQDYAFSLPIDKRQEWSSISHYFYKQDEYTKEERIEVLRNLEKNTVDISVVEAADFLAKLIEAGVYKDIDDDEVYLYSVRRDFMAGSEINKLCDVVEDMYNDDSEPDWDLLDHIKEDLLDFIKVTESFESLDGDSHTRSCFFNHVCEIRDFKKDNPDVKINLINNSYIDCLLALSTISKMTGDIDLRLDCAKKIYHFGPYATQCVSCTLDTYVQADDFLSAIDLAIEALGHSSNIQKSAIYYYKLAYAFRLSGNHDAAQACYLSAVFADVDISRMAWRELHEMIDELDLEMLTPDELDEVLEENGVPILLDKDQHFHQNVAIAFKLINEGFYYLAGAFLDQACEFISSDVISSLSVALSNGSRVAL